MLVLTRRIDEKIVVNDNIIITVLAIEGEKVKIGITAPREVTVLRHELWQAIQEQSQIAEFLAKKPEAAGFEGLRQFLVSESPTEEEKPSAEEPAKEQAKKEE